MRGADYAGDLMAENVGEYLERLRSRQRPSDFPFSAAGFFLFAAAAAAVVVVVILAW